MYYVSNVITNEHAQLYNYNINGVKTKTNRRFLMLPCFMLCDFSQFYIAKSDIELLIFQIKYILLEFHKDSSWG